MINNCWKNSLGYISCYLGAVTVLRAEIAGSICLAGMAYLDFPSSVFPFLRVPVPGIRTDMAQTQFKHPARNRRGIRAAFPSRRRKRQQCEFANETEYLYICSMIAALLHAVIMETEDIVHKIGNSRGFIF
jgi:hypothetical protein